MLTHALAYLACLPACFLVYLLSNSLPRACQLAEAHICLFRASSLNYSLVCWIAYFHTYLLTHFIASVLNCLLACSLTHSLTRSPTCLRTRFHTCVLPPSLPRTPSLPPFLPPSLTSLLTSLLAYLSMLLFFMLFTYIRACLSTYSHAGSFTCLLTGLLTQSPNYWLTPVLAWWLNYSLTGVPTRTLTYSLSCNFLVYQTYLLPRFLQHFFSTHFLVHLLAHLRVHLLTQHLNWLTSVSTCLLTWSLYDPLAYRLTCSLAYPNHWSLNALHADLLAYCFTPTCFLHCLNACLLTYSPTCLLACLITY